MVSNFSRISEDLDAAVRQALALQAGGSAHELDESTPPLALVAFDTPGIQSYLFKVRRPVDVSGGSLLVERFNDLGASGSLPAVGRALSRCAVPANAVIYAAGGSGLVLVAAKQADKLRQALEDQLSSETGGDLRTVTTALPVWPEDLAQHAFQPELDHPITELLRPRTTASRFAATVATALRQLQRERSRQATFMTSIPGGEDQERRCDACGERPGTNEHRLGGAKDERLCDACERRRELGGGQGRQDQARTFEDVVAGSGSDMLAMVYADGASFGRAFQQVESMAQFRALSEAVKDTFENARRRILEEVPSLAGRYQTHLSGGDDLLLVLPARAAFPATQLLVKEVRNGLSLDRQDLLQAVVADATDGLRHSVEEFGVGVGIVFAEIHFPIRFLFETARELLRSAKGRIRDGISPCRDAVDFMVLRSGNPLSDSVTELRKRHWFRKPAGGEPELRLTLRPFSYDELERFLIRSRALANHVPASQIHAMRQEILRGYGQSRSLWRYQHGRAKEDESGWASYRQALGVKLGDVDELLWRRDGHTDQPSFSTDFLDAVEVLDVLPLGKGES